MVQVGEEVGLGQRNAQHGHLQPGEPHTHRRRNAVFAQDALEHQRHHLDDGLLAGRRCLALQVGRPFAQLARQLQDGGGAVVFDHGGQGADVEAVGLHALRRQGLRQRGRRRRRCAPLAAHEAQPRLPEEAPQLPHDALRPLPGPPQRRGAGTGAGIVIAVAIAVHGPCAGTRALARRLTACTTTTASSSSAAATASTSAAAPSAAPSAPPAAARRQLAHLRDACGAAHAGTQIGQRLHALGFQEVCRQLVLGLHQPGQLALQGIERQLQVGARQAGMHPLVHQHEAQRLGAQHVTAFEFYAVELEHALAQPLVGEVGMLGHGVRQARGDDLVLDRIVAQQFEAVEYRGRQRATRGIDHGGQAAAPGQRHAFGPGDAVALVAHQGIAPGLHLALRGRLARQLDQVVEHALPERRQSGAETLDEPMPHDAAQAPVGRGRGWRLRFAWWRDLSAHHPLRLAGKQTALHGCAASLRRRRPSERVDVLSDRRVAEETPAGQTVAPAFGSLGSPSLRRAP